MGIFSRRKTGEDGTSTAGSTTGVTVSNVHRPPVSSSPSHATGAVLTTLHFNPECIEWKLSHITGDRGNVIDEVPEGCKWDPTTERPWSTFIAENGQAIHRYIECDLDQRGKPQWYALEGPKLAVLRENGYFDPLRRPGSLASQTAAAASSAAQAHHQPQSPSPSVSSGGSSVLSSWAPMGAVQPEHMAGHGDSDASSTNSSKGSLRQRLKRRVKGALLGGSKQETHLHQIGQQLPPEAQVQQVIYYDDEDVSDRVASRASQIQAGAKIAASVALSFVPSQYSWASNLVVGGIHALSTWYDVDKALPGEGSEASMSTRFRYAAETTSVLDAAKQLAPSAASAAASIGASWLSGGSHLSPLSLAANAVAGYAASRYMDPDE